MPRYDKCFYSFVIGLLSFSKFKRAKARVGQANQWTWIKTHNYSKSGNMVDFFSKFPC